MIVPSGEEEDKNNKEQDGLNGLNFENITIGSQNVKSNFNFTTGSDKHFYNESESKELKDKFTNKFTNKDSSFNDSSNSINKKVYYEVGCKIFEINKIYRK